MRRTFLRVLALALLITTASYAQSLGDIARENREKKAEDPSTAPARVITNKDLPKDPDASEAPTESSSEADAAASSTAADHRAARRAAERHLAEQRAADQWKRQILAQENKIATLQARIDQINRSMHSSYETAQFEGPSNRYQARQLERVAQILQQLDQQKEKLDRMQEAARRAGMHTPVYDP
jgi:hypothetical protein